MRINDDRATLRSPQQPTICLIAPERCEPSAYRAGDITPDHPRQLRSPMKRVYSIIEMMILVLPMPGDIDRISIAARTLLLVARICGSVSGRRTPGARLERKSAGQHKG
jgi:hypothetical protein